MQQKRKTLTIQKFCVLHERSLSAGTFMLIKCGYPQKYNEVTAHVSERAVSERDYIEKGQWADKNHNRASLKRQICPAFSAIP